MELYRHIFNKTTTVESFQISRSKLLINLSNEQQIELEDYHEQDCCENVKVDWIEISSLAFSQVIDKDINQFYIKGVEGMGIVLFFQNTEKDDIFNEPIRDAIQVNAHNEQNGYYSDDLRLTVTYRNALTDGYYKVNLDLGKYKKDEYF